jgi:predicted CopG family antitoxin
MTSRTISLKEEAYRRLKKMKEGKKSFSDVVMSLTEESRRDFSNIIGADIPIDWERVKKGRKRTEEDESREKVLLGH